MNQEEYSKKAKEEIINKYRGQLLIDYENVSYISINNAADVLQIARPNIYKLTTDEVLSTKDFNGVKLINLDSLIKEVTRRKMKEIIAERKEKLKEILGEDEKVSLKEKLLHIFTKEELEDIINSDEK